MKFIKNSIDSEHLQDSITDADLESQMANCEVKSDSFNGLHPEGIKIPDNTKMDEVQLTKLSNGINRKSGSPAKCNGKGNGFYEDDDFNLVLDDSSEGSDSASKKIDDDSISAPQIVQQIEDLLGITSSSADIQEELNNLDGTDSVEENLDNVAEDSQDTQETFEEIDVNKVDECQEIFEEKIEKNKCIENQVKENKETAECDTSSDLNLVFDEVEVGMGTDESNTTNECNSVTKPVNECKVESTTKVNPENGKDLVTGKSEVKICKPDDTFVENSGKLSDPSESLGDEIPSTQSSGVSVRSDEWTVLDAVESSDEEKLLDNKELSGTEEIHCEPLVKCNENKDEMECEAYGSSSVQNDIETSEKSSCEPDEKLCPKVQTESEECPSNVDRSLSVEDGGLSDQILLEAVDIPEKSPNTSLPSSEGDGARKRCASLDEEDKEAKKPKLEDCLISQENNSAAVLKRPSTVTSENESKRTKLSETLEEFSTCKDEDFNLKENADSAEKVKEVESKSMMFENKLAKDNQDVDPVDSITDQICFQKNNESKDVKPVTLIGEPQILQTQPEELETDTSKQCIENGDQIDFNLSKETISSSDDQNKSSVYPSEESNSSSNDQNKSCEEGDQSHTETCTSNANQSKEPLINSILEGDRPEEKSKYNSQQDEQTIVSNKDQENFSSNIIDSTNKDEMGFKLDDLSSVEKKDPSELAQANSTSASEGSANTENKSREPLKQQQQQLKQASVTTKLSSSIKELEKSLITSKHEKVESSEDMKDASGSKKMTNLDFAIERVVEKARIQTEKRLPILKKFHKDELKKLTRSQLEDIVVSKICEAVTYKSEIGQMRLRTQSLEENTEMWRKKVQQIEKQNRELEMVLKRFLAELTHIKRENQNKVPMPIKVTRSVGLQVVLASSMHGALVTSRSKMNNEAAHQQQQPTKAKQIEKEKERIKDSVKTSTFTSASTSTFIPPNQSSSSLRGRGRPPKVITPQQSRPSTPQTTLQTLAPKVTPPTTPSKSNNTTPVKTIPTPNKDLEVIDLTDKEERAKSTSQPSPLSGPIRVAPGTQVCFVQQSTPSTVPQQPLYFVQKTGPRPQFLVATSSASPQRPMSNVSRPPPALALPVFRSGGHLIPVQTTPQVAVKQSTNNSPAAVARHVPTAMRIQQPTPVNKLQHPAPLPTEPTAISKPGMKAPPPKPQLKIAKTSNGIMLSWSMSLSKDMADMQSYQLYAYQEGNQPPSTGLWKKVGDVNALPLPMACTLTQFIEGHRYHFAVRAKDVHGRIGPFSTPSSILLTK